MEEEEKLAFKHIAPYFPHKLHVVWEKQPCEVEGYDLHRDKLIVERVEVSLDATRPILKPISFLREDDHFDLYLELCEEIGMVRCDNLLEAIEKNAYYALDLQKYKALEEFMNKNHFDWKYNLIKRKMAISIDKVNFYID